MSETHLLDNDPLVVEEERWVRQVALEETVKLYVGLDMAPVATSYVLSFASQVADWLLTGEVPEE